MPERTSDFGAAAFEARDAVSRLRAAGSLVEAAGRCAEDMRAMTGLECVLVYRLDADGSGEALAESRDESHASLLGARLPASDLPDRTCPCFDEGVGNSTSIPIVVDGAPWGLVIGRHRRPHHVSPETRALAGLVADAFALRVHALALAARERELTIALERTELLTREIDHRIKNSLQFVASIMLLQTHRVADEEAKIAFRDAYARVMAVARVHNALQHGGEADMIDLGLTLRQLCADVALSVTTAGFAIEVQARDGMIVPSRTAIALATVAAELLTNALKHAYPDGTGGSIVVSIADHGDHGLALSVCDEGRALPPDWHDRPRDSRGLGMRVIDAMVQQIDGDLSVEMDAERGKCFRVVT